MDDKKELSMRQTGLLQAVRKMRFEKACEGRERGRLSQKETAQLPGVVIFSRGGRVKVNGSAGERQHRRRELQRICFDVKNLPFHILFQG